MNQILNLLVSSDNAKLSLEIWSLLNANLTVLNLTT